VRNISQARDTLASTVASRRAARTALWQDSSFFQDSFFAPDARDDYATSEFAPLSPASGANNSRYANTVPPDEASHSSQGAGDDIAGVVVDTPRYPRH
jgi:hypothetical protein